MSASDAAPLPRLGEVFFDVRGNSRSMRLSWYADTGVAVFSIWQGGMCTGTFRLPIGDLPRMIEILQRGPGGHSQVDAAGHGGAGYAEHGGAGYAESAAYDDYDAGYPGDHDAGPEHGAGEYGRGAHRTDRRRRSDYGADQYGADDYGADDYAAADHQTSEHGRGDYGPGEYGPGERGPGERGSGEHRAADYGRPDYGAGYADGDPGYADGPYRDPGRRRQGHRAEPYGADDYGADGYGAANSGPPDYEQMAGAPRPARWRDDELYQPDVTGQYSVAGDEAGYDQQRFVPPYVRPQAGSSQAGYFDDPEYRLPADPRSSTRHSAGGPSGGQE